ncbi:hypothetical protein [Micromonospora echinofusca]|nr:hypothetical protein [Micromonospora echinofusca]
MTAVLPGRDGRAPATVRGADPAGNSGNADNPADSTRSVSAADM